MAPLQLPAENHQTVSIDAVNLKNRLGDVETNCRNRLDGSSSDSRALTSAHLFGTPVPVEEPSTASKADIVQHAPTEQPLSERPVFRVGARKPKIHITQRQDFDIGLCVPE